MSSKINKFILGYWSTKGLGSASRQMIIYAGIPLVAKIYKVLPKKENGEIIYSNCLYVNVSPASAIEFQHFKDKIIEKINSYFGYKAISDLRLQQNFVPKKNIKLKKSKDRTISSEEFDNIRNNIDKIQDKDLEKSIVNLGVSIKRED